MNCTADTEQFELPMLNYYLFRFIAEATVKTSQLLLFPLPETAGKWIWYLGDRLADLGVIPGGLRLMEMPEMWRFGEQKASLIGSSLPTMSKELS